jgi:hypothetical protein
MKKRGGRAPADTGKRKERNLARFLCACGLEAERIPLSGSAGGSFVGDLKLRLHGAEHVAEVKYRRAGFKTLHDWLDGRDLLLLCAAHKQPLAVMPLSLAVWCFWQTQEEEQQ